MMCIYPGCGRDVGSKGDPHHAWSCGKTICDAYARGVESERARIVKALRDEVNRDRPLSKPSFSSVVVEGAMMVAKGVILERVRLRTGAPLYAALGPGAFVVVELGAKWVRGRRHERSWVLQKSDLIRMGKGM